MVRHFTAIVSHKLVMDRLADIFLLFLINNWRVKQFVCEGANTIVIGKQGHVFVFWVRAEQYTKTLLQINGCQVTYQDA